MNFANWLRVALLGIIQGITEWLPISSTGHLILLDALWKGDPTVFTADFLTVFDVVIQLGSVMAVVTIFYHKLNPISPYKTPAQKRNTWYLWLKVVIATIPSVVIGFFFDDFMDEHLYRWYIVAAMLILYGVGFLLVEKRNESMDPKIMRITRLDYRTAFLIGCAQVLAMVPGTSRSGVTILAGLLLGCSRYIATGFTFYMAIPVMLGASVLKLFKYFFIKKLALTNLQLLVMIFGMVVAYFVSIVVIQYLLKYLKRHDFRAFGIYRIALGIAVLIIFAFFL